MSNICIARYWYQLGLYSENKFAGYSSLRKKVEAEGVRGGIKAFFWAQRTQKGDGGKL